MEGAGAPYVAAFAFAGTEPGNLSLAAGEIVLVTDSSREDWWLGHRAGNPSDSGSFPKAYVKPAPEPEPAPEPADVGSADAPQTNAAGSKPTAEEGVPPAAATASDATAAKAAAEAKAAAFLAGPAHVAAHSYDPAGQPGCIALTKGEAVVVTDSSRADWWVGYTAANPSTRGSFPKDYVKPAPAPEPAPAPLAAAGSDAEAAGSAEQEAAHSAAQKAAAAQRESVAAVSATQAAAVAERKAAEEAVAAAEKQVAEARQSGGAEPAGEKAAGGAAAAPVYTAAYDFDPEGQPGQCIALKAGDVVTVTDGSREDWWIGRVGDGPEGSFPKAYVQASPAADPPAAGGSQADGAAGSGPQAQGALGAAQAQLATAKQKLAASQLAEEEASAAKTRAESELAAAEAKLGEAAAALGRAPSAQEEELDEDIDAVEPKEPEFDPSSIDLDSYDVAKIEAIQARYRVHLLQKAYKKLLKKEYQRKRIATEFLTTETTFKQGLATLKVEWVDQLRFKCQQAAKQDKPEKRKRRLSMGSVSAPGNSSDGFPNPKDIDKIFSNVESLLALSEQLLEMLVQRIGEEKWFKQTDAELAQASAEATKELRIEEGMFAGVNGRAALVTAVHEDGDRVQLNWHDDDRSVNPAAVAPLYSEAWYAAKRGETDAAAAENWIGRDQLAPIVPSLDDAGLRKGGWRLGDEKASSWTPQQKLGDVFVQLGPYFKVYKEYVKNFDDASAHLNAMQEEYPLFAQTLEQLRMIQGLDLPSYLVMPVQRVPRYRMLLDEMIKMTRPTHVDYADLQAALDIIKEVAMQVNTNVTEVERKDRVMKMQMEIADCPFELTAQKDRLYCREEFFEVRVGSSEASESYRVILFNDLLLWCTFTQPYAYVGSVSLRKARLKDLPELSKLPHALMVVGKDKSFTFLAADEEKKQLWVREVREQIASISDDGQWNGAWVDVEGVEDRTTDKDGKECKVYTVYLIKMQTSPKVEPKVIGKRFSEFHKLNATLKKKYPGATLPQMPPKHIPRALRLNKAGNENVVDVRRVALDSYLAELLANVNLRHDDDLQKFLEEEEPLEFERSAEATFARPLGRESSSAEADAAEDSRREIERRLAGLRENKEMLEAQIEFPEEGDDTTEQEEELEGVNEEIESLEAEVQELARASTSMSMSSHSSDALSRGSMASASSPAEGGAAGAKRALNTEAGDFGGIVLIEKDGIGDKLDTAALRALEETFALAEGEAALEPERQLFDMLTASSTWQAKWFVCTAEEGMLSIHEDEEAWHRFESIAVIPVDMMKASDPKVPGLTL